MTSNIVWTHPGYYCEFHDALSLIWNCYCGKQTEEVIVQAVRKRRTRSVETSECDDGCCDECYN